MVASFAKHTGKVGYFGRLHNGRSIGSWAVEGLAKRIDRRLKVAGRGWRVEHLDGKTALIIRVGGPDQEGLWARPVA